jgi:integrase
MKRIKLGKLHTWTDTEIRTFEMKWPPGTRERTAFDLLLSTGQRSSDARAMAWSHVENNRIHVTQKKTGKKLSIPIHPDLAGTLAAQPGPRQRFILTNRHGAPYSAASFHNLLKKAAADAGLPKHCVPHGLRKAAARRLAEAGCSTKQIQAITGHDSLSEVARYTEAAEQEILATAAVERLVRHNKDNDSQT